MLRRLFLILFLSGLFVHSPAQFDTAFAKKNILRCADSLVKGFKTRNWELFTLFSNPSLVGSIGGQKEFVSYISHTFNEIPDSAWKKYEPGNIIQVTRTPRDLQAIIELNTIIEWQGSRITTTSYLIGSSWDGGLFWSFFDSQGDVRAAKMIKPDLSPELHIPERKEKTEPLAKSGIPVRKDN